MVKKNLRIVRKSTNPRIYLEERCITFFQLSKIQTGFFSSLKRRVSGTSQFVNVVRGKLNLTRRLTIAEKFNMLRKVSE